MSPNVGHAQIAQEATLSDFSRLSQGDTITIFLSDTHYKKIEWLHDRVERDLIFGSAILESGLVLPNDCYLENTGFGLLFNTANSEASMTSITDDISGSVFLSSPLPSQLPKRWQPSGNGPRYGKFANGERKTIEAFAEDLENKGFSAGPSWRSSGFDIRLPIWQTSWEKQGCDVSIFLRRERTGLLKPAKFFVSVTDHSHRPMWKHGTHLISKDELSLAEAVDAMSSGIDLAWSKSR